jgi:UDP-glucuronate decarboxylase
MRILLTGAAGFLGSHLVEALLNAGDSVVGIDDLSTGSRSNLDFALKNPKFDFVKHDVRNPYDFEVDAILNFACPASPIHYQIDPVRTMETNFLGIVNALHLAKKRGSIVLQASTSEVYGDPEVSPQSENYWGNVNPIGLRSCYDEGKRAAETLCFDYKRQYGLKTKVIRIFNTYGPRMAPDDGRVVSNFIVQALKGEDLTIYGDGSQTRSFCYVSDLIDGIMKVLKSENEDASPVNLGNPYNLTMIELAHLIIKLTGSTSKIKFLALPSDDPKQRKPNIKLATEKFGWEPAVEIEEGLLSTIKYFTKVL